jgi:dienelactone hydrolase
MRLHMPYSVRYRSHFRSYARAYAYRGLRALAPLSMARSD